MMGPLQLAEWLDGWKTRLPQNIATLLTLYVYVLCIEVRYVYTCLGNLLGAIAAEDARPGMDMYDEPSAARCFKRIEELHADVGRVFAIIGTWGGFLDFDLRNTIGHSDFVLTGSNSGIIPVRNMMRGLTGVWDRRASYPAELIEKLHGLALTFLETFFETVASYPAG
jgi:hypothetical protein